MIGARSTVRRLAIIALVLISTLAFAATASAAGKAHSASVSWWDYNPHVSAPTDVPFDLTVTAYSITWEGYSKGASIAIGYHICYDTDCVDKILTSTRAPISRRLPEVASLTDTQSWTLSSPTSGTCTFAPEAVLLDGNDNIVATSPVPSPDVAFSFQSLCAPR